MICDETGYAVRIEISNCVKSPRLNLSGFEGLVAARLLYLGPAGTEPSPDNPYCRDPFYENDSFMRKAVWSPCTAEEVKPWTTWGLLRDDEGYLWLSYWTHFGLRLPGLRLRRGRLRDDFTPGSKQRDAGHEDREHER